MQLITFNYRILMISINLPKYKFKYLSREYSKNQLELVKGNSYYLYKYLSILIKDLMKQSYFIKNTSVVRIKFF